MDAGLLLPHAAVGRHVPGGAQDGGDLQQFTGVQHAAQVGTLQGRRHRTQVAQGGGAVDVHHLPCRCGLLEQEIHLASVGAGTDVPHPLFRLIADRLGGQQLQDRWKLQGLEGFFH